MAGFPRARLFLSPDQRGANEANRESGRQACQGVVFDLLRNCTDGAIALTTQFLGYVPRAVLHAVGPVFASMRQIAHGAGGLVDPRTEPLDSLARLPGTQQRTVFPTVRPTVARSSPS